MALPSRSPVTWWQNELIWLCVIKNIRFAFDANRNIFTLQSHKIHVHFSDFCRRATFYTQSCHLVARHTKLTLLHFLAQVKLRDLEVCFIATSTLYDWRRIQKDLFVKISLVIRKYAFFRSKQDTSFIQSCRWGTRRT